MAATPGTGIDLLVGTGGTPEGVLAACALRCLGGQILGRLIGRDDDERRALLDAGYDLEAILTTTDLVSGDNVFFAATGVTDGVLLRGVRFESASGCHPVDLHAVPVRNDQDHRGPARPGSILADQLLSCPTLGDTAA